MAEQLPTSAEIGPKLAAMRAYADTRDWPVEIERTPTLGGLEVVRLWSLLEDTRMFAGKTVPAGDQAVLEELADTWLTWWRAEEARLSR